jgi:Tfp pilus assembly protein PilX
MKSVSRSQSGATLIVSLMMLMIMTLLALTSFRLGKVNQQIVGNMQNRNQALSAAQIGIEQVISQAQFIKTPADAVPMAQTCGNVRNTMCIGVNGSTVKDVTAVLTPTCVSIKAIPVAALDFNKPNDAGCLMGAAQSFGVVGGASNNSLCADALWDIQAAATDSTTKAQYNVNQGVGVRVPVTSTCP